MIYRKSTSNNNTIFSSVFINNHNICFTSYYGLGIYSVKTKKMIFYNLTDISNYEYFPVEIINIEKQNSVAYFSTPTVLTIFNYNSKTPRNYIYDECGENLKILNKKYTEHQSKTGIVFVGKQTNKLYINFKITTLICLSSNLYDIDQYHKIWYIDNNFHLKVCTSDSELKSKTVFKFNKQSQANLLNIKCMKNYTIIFNSNNNSIVCIKNKSFKTKTFELDSLNSINSFMYSNKYNNNMYIVNVLNNNTVNVINLYSSKNWIQYKYVCNVYNANYSIGHVHKSHFYAYIYHSFYTTSTINQKLFIFNHEIKNECHHENNSEIKIIIKAPFTDPMYQFLLDDETQTYQVVDQILSMKDNKLFFITSFKSINNQPVNVNAINTLPINI